MNFENMKIQPFLDELASDSPAPGGGSVAALCGSLAAGLVSMVANLTIGKEKYKDNWEMMEVVLVKSEELRNKFVELMNKDTESFNIFMAAIKMPKATNEEITARKKAMGDASKLATEIPLQTLEACVELSEVSLLAARYGNPNTASDAGSAAILAEAAGKAASYNIRINLPGLTDETFAADYKARMSDALDAIKNKSAETSDFMDRLF